MTETKGNKYFLIGIVSLFILAISQNYLNEEYRGHVFVIYCLGMISLAFYKLYSKTMYSKAFEKSMFFVVFLHALLDIPKFINFIVFGDREFMYSITSIENIISILLLFRLYYVNKIWSKSEMKRIKEPGVYIVSKTAYLAWDFIGSLFGGAPGECVIYIKREGMSDVVYYAGYGSFHSENRYNYHYHVKLPIENIDQFENDCFNYQFKTFNYNPIMTNCLTAWKEVFNRHGINITRWKLEFIPSVFMLKYAKNGRDQ